MSGANKSPAQSSPSPSPSSQYDDSSEIDELDHRSRKLNKLLKKNVKRAGDRKRLLNQVRDKAWVLEDEVNLLAKQTKKIKESLADKSIQRNLVVFTAIFSSLALLGYGVNHVVHQQGYDDTHELNLPQ